MQIAEFLGIVAAIAWIPLCLLVAYQAKANQRSVIAWFALAVVLSPLVAFVVLLVTSTPKQSVSKQEAKERPSAYTSEPTDVLDSEHYERSCPKCGAAVNAATGDGLHWPEKEPWRLMCNECDTEIKI
jgi:hypothetical protein